MTIDFGELDPDRYGAEVTRLLDEIATLLDGHTVGGVFLAMTATCVHICLENDVSLPQFVALMQDMHNSYSRRQPS